MPSTLAAAGPRIQGNYRFVNTQLSGSRRVIAGPRIAAPGTIAALGTAAPGTGAGPPEAETGPALGVAVPAPAEVAPGRRRRGPEMTQQPGEHRAFSGETEHGNCSSRPRPEPGR